METKTTERRNLTKRLVLSAIFIAISLGLNAIPAIRFAFGGSITIFSMVPLVLIARKYGVGWGLFSGATFGVLNLLIDGLGNFAWISGIGAYSVMIAMDYVVAFGVIGFAGIFKKSRFLKKDSVAIAMGVTLACALRFLSHFISGVAIWGAFAPEGTPVWLHSLIYNAGYMVPELVITIIGAIAVMSAKPLMRAMEA